MMKLVQVVIAGTLVAGCASSPVALRDDAWPVRVAANEEPRAAQPAAPDESVKSCGDDAGAVIRRGARVVSGVVAGAAGGALGGVIAVAMAGGCVDPTTCTSVVAGMAVIGAAFGTSTPTA